MTYHIARLADYPQLIETVARWHFDEWGALSPGATLEAWTEQIRETATPSGMPATFLALDDDALLGTDSLVANDMETRPDLTPWLAGVFVRPESRGTGVGAALVTRAVAEAAALGVARLYLYTHAARGFYERLGWRAIDSAFYEGQDVTIMQIEPTLTRRRSRQRRS